VTHWIIIYGQARDVAMKKIIKLIVYTLLVAIVFVIGTVSVFVSIFDANEYKQDLSDLVAEQTGRNLQFFGDVSLTVYPALGMKLGALSLSNAPGFGPEPMVKVNKASVSVDVASLFAFKPEIDQFVLDGLEINLQKDKNGVTNWDDLVASSTSDPAADEQEGVASTQNTISDSEPMDIQGAFGGLQIKNANLLWKDAQAGAEYRVQRMNIISGRITPDKPFSISVSAAINSANELDATIDLKTSIQYLLKTGQLNIANLSLSVDASGPMLPTETLLLTIDSKALALDTVSSKLKLTHLNIGIEARGDLFQLGKIKAGIGGQSVLLDLPENELTIDGLKLAIDDVLFEGNLKLIDFTQPAVQFVLTANNLDIDALLGTPPPSKAEVVEEPVLVETGSDEDVQIALPIELLRSIFIDGRLKINTLKLQNLNIAQVDFGIQADNGLIDINPLAMDLYNGKFDGRIQLDVTGTAPVYKVSKKFNGVQIGPLLNDFALIDKIEGGLTASVTVETKGEWLSELKKNSQGNMQLAFEDGVLKGFNLRHMIDKAKAKIRKEKAPAEQTLTTDFSALTLSGIIRNGVFSSDDLSLQAPLVRVGGKGKADLNTNVVDYLVRAKLVESVGGQDGGEIDDLKGILIPVRIKGPFSAPRIDVQLDEMLKDQAAQLLAKEKAQLEANVAAQKAALQEQLVAEKVKLEAAKQAEFKKQKAVLEARKNAEAEKLAAEKARLKAELDAKKKAAKKKAREELLKQLTD
jgi:AsmA protein